MKINKHTLSNGLRILHCADSTSQLVTLGILYKVGARNESPEHTGFAHLFEHLMFGGTKNVPNFDRPLQMASGTSNAFTVNDYTFYHQTVPYQNVETSFWLESDRMESLAFSDESLEVQRKVVMEEFKQNYLNRPFGDFLHLMSSLCYKVHPYRWPTIGIELSHIENATMDEVKDFFFSYYAPNNAILSVSGNISFERVVELSEKWFGRIPAREIRKADIPQEPEQTEERRMTVYRPVPFEFLNLSFHIPSVRNADFVKSDMISDVLSLGKSSRVYRELVDGCKMFSAVDVSVLPRLDTGLLTFYCSLNPGVDLNEAEAALWQTIERLKADGPADDEMTMVKNNYVTEREYDIISVGDRARLMAYYEMLGDAEQVNSLCDNYCSVDGNALREECNRIMTREKANTLFYLKEK